MVDKIPRIVYQIITPCPNYCLIMGIFYYVGMFSLDLRPDFLYLAEGF